MRPFGLFAFVPELIRIFFCIFLQGRFTAEVAEDAEEQQKGELNRSLQAQSSALSASSAVKCCSAVQFCAAACCSGASPD
jgi:hypothetical protein